MYTGGIWSNLCSRPDMFKKWAGRSASRVVWRPRGDSVKLGPNASSNSTAPTVALSISQEILGDQLLDGEEIYIQMGEGVKILSILEDKSDWEQGEIVISNLAMYVVNTRRKIYSRVHLLCIDQAQITAVNSADPLSAESEGDAYILDVLCKDLQQVSMAMRSTEARQVLETLKFLISPRAVQDLFAFAQNEEDLARTPSDIDGWNLYNPIQEFHRLIPNINQESSSWRITTANDSYALCSTYPRALVVPSKISDEQLASVAKFRSRGRLPTVCWAHPHNHAVISRSSQPYSGVLNNRSSDDEAHMHAMFESQQEEAKAYIIDCRPKVNAVANKGSGKGYEQPEHYFPQGKCEINFMNIENIHEMRHSLIRLMALCGQSSSKWLSGLESTKWLDHLSLVLNGAMKIVHCILNEKASVLVHCSDGWDRTSQLTALSQLFLDPYYRTLKGFSILVEKEWLSFGHKFADRSSHVLSDETEYLKGESQGKVAGGFLSWDNKETSPVFLQFVDCVWQVSRQYPRSFEFNERFLLALMDHVYSCRFGTFLFNCELERTKHTVRQRTPSFWTYIMQNAASFTNPMYNIDDKYGTFSTAVLQPNTDTRALQLWTGYFFRGDPSMQPAESVEDLVRSLVARLKLYEENIPPSTPSPLLKGDEGVGGTGRLSTGSAGFRPAAHSVATSTATPVEEIAVSVATPTESKDVMLGTRSAASSTASDSISGGGGRSIVRMSSALSVSGRPASLLDDLRCQIQEADSTPSTPQDSPKQREVDRAALELSAVKLDGVEGNKTTTE